MLKAILLRKKITDAKSELATLEAKDYEARESELAKAIDEATTPDERTAVESAIESFETEKRDDGKKVEELKTQIDDLEKELAELEAKVEDTIPEVATDDKGEPEAVEPSTDNTNDGTESRTNAKEFITMEKRFSNMTITEKRSFVERPEVKEFLERVKTSAREKRSISGGALLIPEVMLPLLREVATETSKLVKYVNVESVDGRARQTVAGTIPEAVWTEACGNLNELNFTFNGVEVDGYKVGGFVPVCNALLADNDVNLMDVIIRGLGKAIGIALDKAILYGTGVKMPQGIVTRLAQTSEPADYPTTARTWVDLHTSNIKVIANTVHGADFFKAINDSWANAKNRGYSNGVKFWAMNETTFSKIRGESINLNAGVVSGTPLDYMPVIGGAIEVLGDTVIGDNQIVAGYGDLYLLAERQGTELAYSEHAQFIQDNTVFKGTARYDGLPVIAEAFVAIAIDGDTVDTTATFAEDTANP
jgi:HK97 family phage major capsid protein